MKNIITKDEILSQFLRKVSRRKPDIDNGIFRKRWCPKNRVSLNIDDVEEERNIVGVEYHDFIGEWRVIYNWHWGDEFESFMAIKRLPKKELIKLVEKF